MSTEVLKLQLLKDNRFYVDVYHQVEGDIILADFKGYDLILLDIMMPGVSGLEVLKLIRTEYSRFELPVIMQTARDRNSDIVNALKIGANDYLVKPINIEVAKARIGTQLELSTLYAENLKIKQASVISTMFSTLNHEINNPLTIALGNISFPFEKLTEEKIKKAKDALIRISELVKKMDQYKKGELEEENYSGRSTIYKIDK